MSSSSTSVGQTKSGNKYTTMKNQKAPSTNSTSPPSRHDAKCEAQITINGKKHRCSPINASAPEPSKVARVMKFGTASDDRSKSEETYSFRRIQTELDDRFKKLNQQIDAFDKKFGFDPRPNGPFKCAGTTSPPTSTGHQHFGVQTDENVPSVEEIPGPFLFDHKVGDPKLVDDKGKGKAVMFLDGSGATEVMPVLVRSHCSGDKGQRFWLEPDSRLGMIYREIAHKLETQPSNILLKKGGTTLPPSTTAAAAGLNSGDVLHVISTDPTFNTDPRFKQVTIRQTTDNNPATMKMLLSPSQTLEDLYTAWSRFVGYAENSYRLVYEEFTLPCGNKTVEKARLKNGGTIYCVRMREDTTFSEDNGESGSKSHSI